MNDTSTYSTSELLNIMGGLELRMQQFYLKVAEKFPQPDDIRVFWDSLAQQESIHATIISTLTNMYRNNPNMFSHIVEIDYSTILKMENFILTSEAKLKNDDFSLDDALNEAFELETLEINEIYDRIIESPKEPFRAVIDHLIESEEAHLNSLIEAIMKYSSIDSLKEKAQNLKSAFMIPSQA
ncbi:MAG: hypothetical protein IIB39_02980 [Candidatus Marinimicrobia bacterium]|nr:hypothetical protein [Candidatus Neomarinimicrobiota bacterium]